MSITTILIEDNPKIREALVPALLELGNMDVVAVVDGADEAVAVLEAHRDTWQLAVVDLFLRDGSGLSVVQACRSRRRSQFVIVLSNYATPKLRKRCMELGADAVFDKSTELRAFFNRCALLFSV